MKFVCLFAVLFAVSCRGTAERHEKGDALVFTVATESTDGYKRFTKSAKYYNVPLKTLGFGEKWLGGDMHSTGGGFKVNLLKEALKDYKDSNEIVLFTDGYDVMYLATIDKIVEKFKKTGARILFGAENFCWPDKSLSESYPPLQGRGARYLNSGMFIGYASDLFEILQASIKNADDDQLFYTKVFLDAEIRDKHKIQLDHKSAIFQNLNGAIGEIKMEFDPDNGEAYLFNSEFKTTPCIVHANGPSKMILNNFGNYLAGSYHNSECHACKENLLELDENHLPIITMAIFAEKPMPFFEEFLDKILSLDYPKENIHLFIHNDVEYHTELVEKFITQFGAEYRSVKKILPADKISERAARNLAVAQTKLKESDYMFVVDSEAHLDKPSVLKALLRLNKHFVGPLTVRPGEVWSNFWGAISDKGYYARSHDYMDIANNVLRGLWNVPFVSSCYLIQKQIMDKVTYDGEEYDPDMTMCQNLRKHEVFMFVTNEEDYGHLVNGEYFDTTMPRPDFYMLMSNPSDWEQRYIHPEYVENLNPNKTRIMPCTDVYWFPIVTTQFCKDLIAIMENFGRWSDGTNSDTRLQGGYEAVPTRDIHMNQVGLEPLWLKFLQLYVRPLQEAVFLGYFHNPPRSLMNFVVRYRPDEQPSLRPHHDSSTYTINIALNQVGVDYEGGGCHFLRYNCSVQATKMGWMLMHPGRLTHFHEGLRTTEGTRYIMISFVDP